MFRTALTMVATVLIAAASPSEERSLATTLSTNNYPPSPTIKNLIIHPQRTSIRRRLAIFDQ